MKKHRLFKKDASISLASLRATSRFLAVFLGMLFTLATTSVFAAVEKGGGDPVKRKSSISVHTNSYGDRSISSGSFPAKDLPELGKKAFIYPYEGNENILGVHGDILYQDYDFKEFAKETSDNPSENEHISDGVLDKNLIVEKVLDKESGVTSWTITFYPKGQIYNKPGVGNEDRHHNLDNAQGGIAITHDLSIVGNKIEVETYDSSGQSIGTKTINPTGYNGWNEKIPGMKSAEFTSSAGRTKKLFFGSFSEGKDPLNLRAGGLYSVSQNDYARLFDKSFVFESYNGGTDKYVVKFKTTENYTERETLNVYGQTSQVIQHNRDKYISGVMAGVGSWQQDRTVAGISFCGKKLGDKIVVAETIEVNETFDVKSESIVVPPRSITFDKPQSRTYDYLIEYSLPIKKTFEMKSGQKITGNPKKVTTKYIVVDYEKFNNDPRYANSIITSVNHTDYMEIRRIKVSMTPIPGYGTKFETTEKADKFGQTQFRKEKYGSPDRMLYLDITHKADEPNAPTLTTPTGGATSVTFTVPEGSKVGDIIKLYKRENGVDKEIGSYTLKEGDLGKSNIEVPLNEGVTIVEGEQLVAKTSRGTLSSESSNVVSVEVLKCTANPAPGDALNTLVGVSTLNRGNGDWNLKGLGAYIALESNTKGFVITRNADPANNIAKPIEGMLVWDTTAKCLKLYSDKTGSFQWNCIKQGCNH